MAPGARGGWLGASCVLSGVRDGERAIGAAAVDGAPCCAAGIDGALAVVAGAAPESTGCFVGGGMCGGSAGVCTGGRIALAPGAAATPDAGESTGLRDGGG